MRVSSANSTTQRLSVLVGGFEAMYDTSASGESSGKVENEDGVL